MITVRTAAGKQQTFGPFPQNSFVTCMTDDGINDQIRSYRVVGPNTTPPSTQPDNEFIGKSVATVVPQLQSMFPRMTVKAYDQDKPRAAVYSPNEIQVLYKQLPIPPNVRAVPGTFQVVMRILNLPTVTDQPQVTVTATPITTTPPPTTIPPMTTTPAPTMAPTTTAAPTTMTPTTPVPAACPDLEEGESVLHTNSGTLFRVQNGALRPYPSLDVFRSWGSPDYRAVPGNVLDQCPKGPPIETRVTEPPAPVTPAPTPEPTMDPTLYIMIHKDTYDIDGKLHVLTARFGGLVLEPYKQRELAQTFLTNSASFIRNAASGEYIDHNEGCIAPILSQESGEESIWTFQNTGTHQYAHRIVSACGNPLRAEPGRTVVDLSIAGEGTTWYIIPVGSASLQ
jgi:hypothetical protein